MSSQRINAMDNEIVDLITYREHQENTTVPKPGVPEDLATAIQHLIQRLREADPIK